MTKPHVSLQALSSRLCHTQEPLKCCSGSVCATWRADLVEGSGEDFSEEGTSELSSEGEVTCSRERSAKALGWEDMRCGQVLKD